MILALDSSQSAGSIAILNDGKLLYSAYFDIRITHSETLMPAIDFAFQLSRLDKRELKAIYVCLGPGSFTGLRIGIASAKGIAFALKLPVYGYNSLEMLALNCLPTAGKILVVNDAKMQECYAALYDERLGELQAPEVLSPAEILNWDISGAIVSGSAMQLFTPYQKDYHLDFAPPWQNIPRAEALYYLQEYKAPQIWQPETLKELEPFYLRDSTAQIKARQRQKR